MAETKTDTSKYSEKYKGLKYLEYAMISLSILLICVLIFVDNGSKYSKVTVTESNNPNVSSETVLVVNINTADVEELTTLKGIGTTKAEAIVAYRENHGKFKRKKDIIKVKGIGPKIYSNIKDFIEV